MIAVLGGELGYRDDDGNYNIGQFIKGKLFHWPFKLVSVFKESTIPPDFEAELAPPVPGVEKLVLEQEDRSHSSQPSEPPEDDEEEPERMELEDDHYLEARRRTDSSSEKMVAKYPKNHEIDRFEVSDIVTFKLPRGTRTPADHKRRLFGRVLGVPQQDIYEIQLSME